MTETDRKTARVIDRNNRVLFEGTDKDARLHVERNFPHIHVEPGAQYVDGPEPDVKVMYAAGGEGKFVGGEWNDPTEDDNASFDNALDLSDVATEDDELPSLRARAPEWNAYADAHDYPADAPRTKSAIVAYYSGEGE